MTDQSPDRSERSLANDAFCSPTVLVTVIVEVLDNDGNATTKVEQMMPVYPDPRRPESFLGELITETTADIVGDFLAHVDATVQRTAWGR